MKHFLLFFFAFSLVFKAQSQCTAAFQYPANTLTPTGAWSDVDPCNYAGEYAVINVVAGNVYEFSTMGIHGSTISYDTELTLRNAVHYLDGNLHGYCSDSLARFSLWLQFHLQQYPI
ncbi:MAG: hypothetical protein EBU82_08620 [Flavobacteriia bacterium]|nr:hypothetical protein [Flavobacteriia bacterium]